MQSDLLYNLNLVVSSVLLTVSVLFVLLFYKEWRRQARTKNEQYIPLAMMVLYLFLTIGIFMMMNSNYFIDPAIFQTYIESGAYFYLILFACVIIIGIFVYIAERIIPKKTKHIFLIYFSFLAVSFYIFKIIDIPFIGFYVILLIPIGVLMGVFAYYLIWKSSGQIRQKMFIVTVGYVTFILAIVLFIRFILVSEFIEPFDPIRYFIPLENKVLVLIAAMLTGIGFLSIPSFTEFNWREKIRQLYLVNPQGICVFQYAFKSSMKSDSIRDEDLFSGGIFAIQSLMQEMINSDKTLSVIDHKDAKIIFEQSPHANVMMIADENLYIIHFKLQQLLKQFELLFGELMKDWNGDLNLFKPLQAIIKNIFEIKN